MGGFLGKYEEAGYLDDKSEDITPKKVLRNKRLLSLDPRSPSEGIARTPIIVEKTPVPGVVRNKLCSSLEETPRINRSSDKVQDPRSPTIEFSRTPINPCHSSVMSRQVDPLAMKDLSLKDSPVSLYMCDTESGIGSTEVTPVLKYRKTQGHTSQLVESPDSALGIDAWKQPRMDCGDQRPQTQHDASLENEANPELVHVQNNAYFSLEARDSVLQDENIFIPANTEMIVSDESETKLSYAIPPFISRKTGSVCMTAGVVRSPLSLVENSRALSQRNVIMPSGGKQTPKYSRVVDKENLYH
ncbi:unnamed protein product [Lymnaea stagnalis]|uniref:Uncharacterized protein n=1 Tax=Lymnaea stagnalis TaxID=6523 RepID=A0AAV2ICD7_LYMST